MRAKDFIMEMTRPLDRQTANDILLRSGYEMLGTGAFATIYEKPGASYVLKLFDDEDHAYQAFIELVRQHPNPHFPRLIGKPVRVSPGFHAIRMEKLAPYRGDPHLFRVYMMNRDFKDRLVPNGYTANQMSDVEEIFYEYPDLKVALDLIIDHLIPEFRCDIQPWNLMARGSTIVITDPIANHVSDGNRQPIPMPEKPLAPTTRDTGKKLDAILSDDDLMAELFGDNPPKNT